jgi:hypothetical protein
MTYCEHCGDPINYLPFKCKYCGGNFCEKHRLPENHECTFEIRHKTQIDDSQVDSTFSQKSSKIKIAPSKKKQKNFRWPIKQQQEKFSRPFPQKTFNWVKNGNGTKTLLIIILVTSILSSILYYLGLEKYIYFSLSALINNFTIYTIFTALFITEISLFSPFILIDLIFLIVILFFTYVIAKSIEFRFGIKFLFKLFIFSGLFSLLFYTLLRMTLIPLFPIISMIPLFPIGVAWGGILGLISFSIFSVMDQEITAFMIFIPIRMRGRTFLFLIVLFRIFPILFSPLSFIFYLPDLGGILGAYILFKYQNNF